jgi:hypothetical protein
MGPKARARSKLHDPTPSPDSSPSGKGSDIDLDANIEIENFLANRQASNATTLPTRQPLSLPNPLIRPRVSSGGPPDETQPAVGIAPTSPMAPLPPKRSKRIVEKEVVRSKAKETDKGKAKAAPAVAQPHPTSPFTFLPLPTYPITRYPPTAIPTNSIASSSNAIPLQPPFNPVPPLRTADPNIPLPIHPTTPLEMPSPSRHVTNVMDVSPDHLRNTTTNPVTPPHNSVADAPPRAMFTSEQVSAAVSRGIAEALLRLEERDQTRSTGSANGTSERPPPFVPKIYFLSHVYVNKLC